MAQTAKAVAPPPRAARPRARPAPALQVSFMDAFPFIVCRRDAFLIIGRNRLLWSMLFGCYRTTTAHSALLYKYCFGMLLEAPPQTDKAYRFLAKNPSSKRVSL